jgi:hypothetical protein
MFFWLDGFCSLDTDLSVEKDHNKGICGMKVTLKRRMFMMHTAF